VPSPTPTATPTVVADVDGGTSIGALVGLLVLSYLLAALPPFVDALTAPAATPRRRMARAFVAGGAGGALAVAFAALLGFGPTPQGVATRVAAGACYPLGLALGRGLERWTVVAIVVAAAPVAGLLVPGQGVEVAVGAGTVVGGLPMLVVGLFAARRAAAPTGAG